MIKEAKWKESGNMDEKKSYLAGAGIAILFGTSFLASKTALSVFVQPAILAWRFTVAACILWILAIFHVIHIDLKGKPWYRLLGILVVYPLLSYTLETKGLTMIPSSQAGVIVSLMPVIAMIMGAVFLKEHMKWTQNIMALLSVAGVVVITVCSEQVEAGHNLLGILCLLGSTSCGAGQGVLVRSQRKHFSSLEMTLVMNTVAAVFFTLELFILHGTDTFPLLFEPILKPEGLIPVLYLGAGCSIGAMFCLNYVNSHMEVARAAVFNNLSTIVSVLAGVFIAHEGINIGVLIGMVLILLGVWGVNYFSKAI